MQLINNWFTFSVLLFILCFNFNQVYCKNSSQLLIEKQIRLITSGFSSLFWEYISNPKINSKISNLSVQCKSSLKELLNSASNGQIWALKFLSFSGTRPNDFLDGSYTAFGDYDSCLAINNNLEVVLNHNDTRNIPADGGSGQLIAGKYCLTSLEPDFLRNDHLLSQLYPHHFDTSFNLTIKLGLCIPSKCSSNDLAQLMNQVLNDYSWRLIDVNHCEVSKTFLQRYSSAKFGQKVALWLIVLLVVTVVWGTLLDMQTKSLTTPTTRKSNFIFWIEQFSAFKSIRSLLRKPDASSKIMLLDQLRFTCAVIVVILHSIMWMAVINAGFLVENTRKGIELYKQFWMQPLANDWITEGLLFVGGISSTTVLIKKFTPETPITTYLYIIFRRAALLVPPMIAIIAVEIALPLIGSGPIYRSIAEFRSSVCLKNWIFNILHLHNYNDPLEICASHTWSIAVEWQLFIGLCFLIYLYKRSYRIGLTANLFLIVFGFQRVVHVIIKHDLIPHILIVSASFRDISNRMSVYYVATEAHFWSYFWGSLLVFIMLGNHERRLGILLNKSTRYKALGILTIIMSFTSVPWNVFGLENNQTTTVISSIAIKLMMGIWCSLIILYHGKRFRKFLFKSKSNDIYIYNDDADNPIETNSQSSSVINDNDHANDKSSSESNSNNNNDNNNTLKTNNQQSQSTINANQPKVLSHADHKSLHRFEVTVRLFKSAYFVHTIIYALYFTTLRNPLVYSFTNYLQIMATLTPTALICGLIWHILCIGPIERIQYVLSKSSIKSKTS